MSELPLLQPGQCCRLQTTRFPGRLCVVVDNRFAPLYTVRLALPSATDAPNQYDTKAPQLVVGRTSLTPL